MVSVSQLDLPEAEELLRQIGPFVKIRRALHAARELGRSTRELVGAAEGSGRRDPVALTPVTT